MCLRIDGSLGGGTTKNLPASGTIKAAPNCSGPTPGAMDLLPAKPGSTGLGKGCHY